MGEKRKKNDIFRRKMWVRVGIFFILKKNITFILTTGRFNGRAGITVNAAPSTPPPDTRREDNQYVYTN